MQEYIPAFLKSIQLDGYDIRENASKQMGNFVVLERLNQGLESHYAHYFRDITDEKAARLKIEEYLKKFEYVKSSSKNIDFYILKTKIEAFILNYVNAYIEVEFTSNTISIVYKGDKQYQLLFNDFINLEFPENGVLVTSFYGVDKEHNLISEEGYLHMSDNQAIDCFYPWLNGQTLQSYFNAFLTSKENVLLLIGPPGTGKSTFVRTLLIQSKKKAHLTYSKQVIESDKLTQNFYASDSSILAMEDIDEYLGNRTDGNSLMSTFLNASEGIVYRHDKKIIFSTNLPSIDKIDPALLRPGRCFDIIKFDFLTEKQALLVQTTLGLETTDLDKKRAWSLSEILNPLQVGTQTQMREARKLGFHQ